ncbi:autophagy-related protein 27 [Mycena belliarum]|uniref:Autophagy-related protein 27 n=1 Tax=Mycena belliarum TaxID=1033014 RepID=A0AAD6XPN4_9AGAR|nr:autophagy-related protein 27 [Mycena belliae]
MILRPLRQLDLPLFLLAISWSTTALTAAESFDCHFNVGSLTYDLSSLDGEQLITRERSTPPTREVDSVALSLCSDLKSKEGVSEADQCPPGTRVCLTKINKKDSSDRIVSVIPIAQTATLDPLYSALSAPKGVSVLLHGGVYPHPVNGTEAQQSVNITFVCETSDQSTLEITSYDGALLQLKWATQHGCGFIADDGKPEKEDPGNDKPSGSGSLSSVGWFLLLLLVAFITYMGLGAYFNYTTYGASGLDLIPHRDFWMEVPYMMRDVLSHLCSTVRPRRSSNRGGYVAV